MTKVIDIINKKKAPFASFELVPPLKGSDISKLYNAIEPLMEFAPPFINITYHRDEIEFRQKADFRKSHHHQTPRFCGHCRRYHEAFSDRSGSPPDLRRCQQAQNRKRPAGPEFHGHPECRSPPRRCHPRTKIFCSGT